MKKFAAIAMSVIFALSAGTNAFALLDDAILKDPVMNTFTGATDGAQIISNLQFTDISGHWASEAVARTGALNLVKGYDKKFGPDNKVSKQEALAFVLRVLGMEMDAVDAGNTAKAQMPVNSPTRTLWSIGYLSLARDLELITYQDYLDAVAEDQAAVAENAGFLRENAATREEIADWLYRGLTLVDPEAFIETNQVQGAISFTDWDQVDIGKMRGVEAIIKNGIMKGDGTGYFRPKNAVTRAETAQVLKGLGQAYYNVTGLMQKDGTVGAIRDNQYSATNSADVWRNLYIRTSAGDVDILQFMKNSGDAVVYKDGQITGMTALEEGDTIQYIADWTTDKVLYIQVTKSLTKTTVQGKLYNIDTNELAIHVRNAKQEQFIFSYMEGLVTERDGVMCIKMEEEKWHPVSTLPYGSYFELTLQNNLVVAVRHIGEATLIPEVRGIVTENDTDYGILTIYDNNGVKRNFNYYENDLTVEKRTHYDIDDEIGYLDEVFPNFRFDPMDTVISEIEAGDIVFIRPLQGEPDVIEKISAATNYTMKYGKVTRVEHRTDATSMLIEFEDKRTAWYDAFDNVFVSKNGKPSDITSLMTGDWVKLLVNEAIIEPGYVMESLKEVTIEGVGHVVSGIVKGNLSSVDAIQQKLVIENAYTLNQTGWGNYKNLQQFSLSTKDIDYFYNDKQISLDYAQRYLKHGDATVYVALQENFGGEAVAKVTFRNERDQVLESENVLYTSGTGTFNIIGYSKPIETDAGTIVRRHGRLVDGGGIIAPDYAAVVLNGEGKAAVVDIQDEPSTDKLSFARGIIKSVDLGKSFKTQSMAILYGDKFVFTPVQREYDIDHNTIFLGPDGIMTESSFMALSEDSPVDTAYNIVADGSHADYVVDAPYAKFAVRGTIQSVEGDAYTLKDAYYYDNTYGRWNKVSNTNSMIVVTMLENTLIGKSNEIVAPNKLKAGDQIRVLTGELPQKVVVGSEIDAVIVLVEK